MDTWTPVQNLIESTLEECRTDIMTDHILKGILHEEECVVPYVLVSKAVWNESFSPSREANVSHHDSIGGSPLKLAEYDVRSSTVTNSATENIYKPCTVNEARQLLTAYQLRSQTKEMSHPLSPLWVLCNSDDKENIIALSSHVTKSTEEIYIFKSHMVCVKVLKEAEVNTEFTGILKKLHRNLGGIGKGVDVNCSAVYNIFGAISTKENSINRSSISSSAMNLHLTWNKFNMSLVPPRDAKAYISATIEAGDERSAAISRFRELSTLLELVRGFLQNEIHWRADVSESSPELRVKSLLEDFKSGCIIFKTEDDSESSDALALASNQRKDYDFTELLWLILKDCTSSRELIECLKCVFDCIKSGQVHPMVHRTNNTSIANLVRDSFHKKIISPSLEGCEPLKILLDIGIEKLTRDYICSFVGTGLVTLNHLEYFLTANQDLSFSERAERLERLHYAFELVVLLDQFVNVPQMTLSLSARHALEYYEKNPIDTSHKFSIPVQTSIVSGTIEKCRPCQYKVILSENRDNHNTHSVALVSTQPSISGFSYHLPESVNEEEENIYYLTTVTQNVTCL